MPSQVYVDLKGFQDAVDQETNRIAAEVQVMLDTINGGLTAAEATELIAAHAPLVERLKAIGSGGAVVPDPVP